MYFTFNLHYKKFVKPIAETDSFVYNLHWKQFLQKYIYERQKFMKEYNAKERHHLLYLEYALRLASQYHPDADVSRFIFRVLNTTANSLVYLKDEMLQKYKLHPYLVDMLKGGRALRTGWKHRGGGYSDSVTPHGWQSFKENLIQAGKHFSDAYHRHPNYPEAPAQMIAVVGASSDSKKMAIWLRRSLIAQINYREAIENYVWYKLPSWGGSTADLRNFSLSCSSRTNALISRTPTTLSCTSAFMRSKCLSMRMKRG